MYTQEHPMPVDLLNPEWDRRFRTAPIYRKHVTVRYRIATQDEIVETVLADGTQETKKYAQAGDTIIINPTGEEYIPPATRLAQLYEAAGPGLLRSKGKVRVVANPFKVWIKIR